MKQRHMAVAVIGVTMVSAGAILFFQQRGQTAASATPQPTSTATDTVTRTPSAMATNTATSTATHTPTATYTPSATATLANEVVFVTVVNDGVILSQPPTRGTPDTATPLPTVAVPFPVEALPLAGTTAPELGWRRYESADLAFDYVAGRWFRYYTATRASARGYSYTADPDARMVFRFEGAGVRLRYVAYGMYGMFEVHIDGRLAVTVDSYSREAQFLSTQVFGLTQGAHTLEVVNTGRKNADSAGVFIALDSVEVYKAVPPTVTPVPSDTPEPTQTPRPVPVKSIRQIGAATSTPVAPVVVAASLLITYDENGNRAADPAEGVRGIPVRLVRVDTNEVLAVGFTNAEGFVRVEAMSAVPVRLVVPYFSKVWDVPAGRAAEARFTLVIPPGNQPGLIP